MKFHTKPHAVEYRVEWSQLRGRFDIFRGAERMPSFSRQQATAIGLALRDAQWEATQTGLKIIVTSMRNGRRIVEWDGSTRLRVHEPIKSSTPPDQRVDQ